MPRGGSRVTRVANRLRGRLAKRALIAEGGAYLRAELLRVRIVGPNCEGCVDLGQGFGYLPICEEHARELDADRHAGQVIGHSHDAAASESYGLWPPSK